MADVPAVPPWAVEAAPDLPEHPDSWVITDTGAAEWAMAKLAQARAVKAAAQQQYDAWHAQLAEWYTKATADATRTEAFMQDRLAAYALHQRAEGGPATLRLPSGSVATRKGGKPTIHVDDADALLQWLHGSLPGAVRTKEEVAKADLLAACQVVERGTGCYWVHLSDGSFYSTDDGEQPPAYGTTLADGRTVTEVVPITELALVTPDGEPVPYITVQPARTTANVAPNAQELNP